MFEYKTVVTDYEGMQEALATYAGQGWRLVSVNPDTFRIIISSPLGIDIPTDLNDSDTSITRELSASYYLLVFEREAGVPRARIMESASEQIGYVLPELYGDTPEA